MKSVVVKATVPADKEKGTPELIATVNVQYADTLEEAKAAFGEEALLTNALSNWVITLQSNIRNGLRRGEDQAAIQARLAGAKMGVAQAGVRVDPVQAYLAKFQSATPEEQKKMLAELQSRAAKK